LSILGGKKDAESPYEAFCYYQMDQLQAVRSGKWKPFVAMESKKRNWGKPEGATPIKLFDLETDVGESIDVQKSNPKVVKRLLSLAEKARVELGDGGGKGNGQRPAALFAPRMCPSIPFRLSLRDLSSAR
jgi:arylsulfatase A